LSLRNRLLLAAAGIVGVSLLTSGILSLVLVRTLEFDNAQLDLDRDVISIRHDVLRAECLTPAAPPASTACAGAGAKLASGTLFEGRISNLLPIGTANRMLLMSPDNVVLFDSAANASVGNRVQLLRTRRIQADTVAEGNILLDGQPYIASGATLAPKRDPLGAGRVVLVRSSASINALAVQELLPRFLEAGLIALVVALALALLLSRAFARPLSELARAAEDVAAGNYARRVSLGSRDEIGVVARSFNRMAEAVERARTMQRDFLANVSHELKTPLTSLIGFSQALVDGSLETPEQRARAAEIIHEEAQRVLRMSQELLDLARVEAGQMPIHPTDVDLKALLEQELEIVRPRAAGRGLVLRLTTPDSLQAIRADPERLHQIVDNLLDNAVKYASPGAPVEVKVESSLLSVEVSVANGVDHNAPDPDRIFDRFYRGDPSRSSSATGVGLGLSISRELATALGGKLWAELNGSTLRLRLTLPAQL
jgi:signal transduction histidine kinase